ncbi:unnamed protein product [Meloidogyne enterolobii]|uniref:Uncharacterized protein n=1 Tax=Meloidogyne enterolobii TaxID=390850 RepID=A0ACB0Z5A4_MELEN
MFQIQFLNLKGSNSYEDQVKYIEEKFESLNSNPNKTVYIHETCATDTNQVIKLYNLVKQLRYSYFSPLASAKG